MPPSLEPAASGVISFAVSEVAENEERKDRQGPNRECNPKPDPARSSTLPSHLNGEGD